MSMISFLQTFASHGIAYIFVITVLIFSLSFCLNIPVNIMAITSPTFSKNMEPEILSKRYDANVKRKLKETRLHILEHSRSRTINECLVSVSIMST